MTTESKLAPPPINEALIEKKNVEDADNIKRYFRQLKFRLITWLMIAFTLPHIAFSIYFHFQLTRTLKETGKSNLVALAESERNTIDLFLQERVINLFRLFRYHEFSLTPSQHTMEYFLQNIRQVSDAFIDVGFLNEEGIQIGYAGPFPYLQGENYSGEKWFKTLHDQNQDYFISDIYLGFRKKPHFTIAVKQKIDDRLYVMRSTLDPDKFYMFLRTISHGKEVESSLVNNQGLYQVVDPDRGELLGKSEYMPHASDQSGATEIKIKGDSAVIAHAWLKEAPWALVVKQPLKIAHAKMYKARQIMTISLAFIIVTVATLIWYFTTKQIDLAQLVAEKRAELQLQLIHASKLASVGELATGVAHEINNPLAIITATTGVIRDMLNPEFNLDSSPENIVEELNTIDSAAFRARGITQQLLNYGRKSTPRLSLSNVNRILDDVLGGLIEREFKVSDIEIVRDYQPDLPEIRIDSDQIRQVFLNIINNAGDAIEGPGKITLSTESDADNIRITITDTGRGMDADQMKKIFDPFFTTKEVGKGTGLGLSVSLGIVESMGGSIDVQSLKGAGSSFTVSLPKKRA